jgi:chaperonin GroEL
VEEGIVPGGGVAMLRAIKVLDKVGTLEGDEKLGVLILKRALEEPIRQIAANSGAEPSIVVSKVREKDGAFGYNAQTDVFEDLYKAGVIDPAKVARAALENASSIAGLLLTTDAIIADKPEDKKNMPPMPGGGGMGDMGMY